MLSAALLLRLSTMLLVPLLVVTGLGTLGHDAPASTGPEAAAHARALVASASGDLRAADPGAPSPQSRPDAVATSETPGDAASEDIEVAAAKGAAQAEEAEAKKQADAKKAKKAAAAKKAKKAAAAKKAQDEAKAKKQAEAKKAKKAAAAAPADVRPRSLYLATGHGRASNGRWQPGAQHPGGALEVEAAQVMVDAMVEVLKDAPGVQLISESGEHPNVTGSVAAANAAGVDDCIEVHQDTAAAPPGAFAHWYTGANEAKRLADGLVSSIHDRGVPIRTDWHRERPGLYWVRKSTCRAVLVEVGRVGDYGVEKLRELGRGMALAYLEDTAKARNVAPPS